MGIFKKLLEDLENKDPQTLEMLKSISFDVDSVEKKEFDSSLFEDTKYAVEEKLVYGYKVLYQYRKKIILEKDKAGQDIERVIYELQIISIVEPLTNKIVEDEQIRKTVENRLMDPEK